MVTPLSPTVVWKSDDPDALDAQYEHGSGFTYAREGHPNAVVLAEKLDWMEGAPEGSGVVVGSGMAAIASLMTGLLSAGDHVVGGDRLYGRTHRMLAEDLPRMGFATTTVDTSDAAAVADALTPETRLVVVEVMTNPTLQIADVDGIAEVTRRHGATLVVDNTFATPRAFRPFDHGADVVVESITKFLAGHSDVTLGYVAARDTAQAEAIRTAAVTWGPTPSPFDCWLAERGLHTFEVRYDRAEENARLIADAMASHPAVDAVIHPGRPDHPQYQRARALFGGRTGTMVGIRLAGDRPAANAFVRAAGSIPFAPTLGDVATTISHPASSSHRAMTPEERLDRGIGEGFIRLSVGIEDPDLLLAELTAGADAARTAG